MSLPTRLTALAIAAVVAAPSVGAAAPATLEQRSRYAASYVVANQAEDGSWEDALGFTADGVLALVAARRAPKSIERALDYLEEATPNRQSIGETAKLVLAAVAGGRDPRAFGGADLVEAILDSEQSTGQYGEITADPYDGELTGHALAILALAAADDADPSTNSLTWLLSAQCDDGGWQHTGPPEEGEDEHCYAGDGQSDFFTTDTDTTSVAVQAVAAHPDAAPYPENPVRFFRSTRDDEKGGWGYNQEFPLTAANSTAAAIQAYVALGKRLPDGSMRALKKLQYRFCGDDGGALGNTWEDEDGDGDLERTPPNLIASIAAILGLLKEPLPVDPATVRKRVPRPDPC